MTSYYDDLINVAEMFMGILIGACPKDTLALVSSISYEVLDTNNVILSVGDEVVDYAYYTNAKWTPPINLEYFPSGRKRSDSDKKRLKSFAYGGNNPNEAWFDNSLLQGMQLMAESENGVVLSEL